MNFRQHLAWLKSRHQLLTIDQQVDCHLEAAEIVRQLSHQSLPSAIHLQKLDSSRFSVVANLFFPCGSDDVFSGARDGFCDALAAIPDAVPGTLSLAAWLNTQSDYAYLLQDQLCSDLKKVETLYDLPLLRYWPGDAGPYLSLSVAIVRALDGTIHCGVYRLQVQGPRQLTVHCLPGSRTQQIYRDYQQAGQEMPMVVVMGIDPAVLLSALLPLDTDVDPIGFAGWMQGEAISCCASPEHGLPMPSHCEVVLEGVVGRDDPKMDGPHGNFRGTYTTPVLCPVMTVDQIWGREDAICPVTVVGPPPAESYCLARARLPYVKWRMTRDFEWVTDVKWIETAEYHNALIVQIKDYCNENGRDVLFDHQLMKGASMVVLVDQSADLSCPEQIVWQCFNVPWREVVYYHKETLVVDATQIGSRQRLESDSQVRRRVEQRLKRWNLDMHRGL